MVLRTLESILRTFDSNQMEPMLNLIQRTAQSGRGYMIFGAAMFLAYWIENVIAFYTAYIHTKFDIVQGGRPVRFLSRDLFGFIGEISLYTGYDGVAISDIPGSIPNRADFNNAGALITYVGVRCCLIMQHIYKSSYTQEVDLR